MIRVRVLGGCEIQNGRKRITLSTEMVFAVAFYLCVRAGERLARDEVAELFWPGPDAAKGRHSLRQMLYKLKQKGLPLDEVGEGLFLDHSALESDISDTLEESWPERAGAEAVLAAGELLPGFTRAVSPAFQEWLDGVRARVAAQHRRAALAQISRARREARWADLERWAQQVLKSDPLNEEATLARAESAAMAGSKAAALEILDQYMEELGEYAPRIGLPATVLRKRISDRQSDWVARGPREVPLVGRTELMSRLTGLVDAAARGEGSAVLLWGAPGVGKTRLAHEARIFAELRGFRTVIICSDLSHAARPLSTVLTLLLHVRDLPGAAGCSPTSLAVVQRVLRDGAVPSVLAPDAAGSGNQSMLHSSAQDLCRSVAEESRMLVILDDVHNVDPSSLEVLRHLLVATSGTRMSWILTSRQRDTLIAESAHTLPHGALSLLVPALPLSEAEELAQALAQAVPGGTSPAMLADIARAAGGNPLFVRELSMQSPARPAALPRSLRQLMQERLGRLSSVELRLIRVVAILGHSATVGRVRTIVNPDTHLVTSAVEALESEGLLHLGASQALELHECWQAEVTAQFTEGVRALLSLECAEQLDAENTSGPRLDTIWRAAELFEIAGETDRARASFLACAGMMNHRGLATDAAQVLSRALALCTNDAERIEILARRGMALYDAGDVATAVDVCRDALSLRAPPTPAIASARTVMQAVITDCLTKLHRVHHADLALLASLARDPLVPPDARQVACLYGTRVVFNDASSPLEREFLDASRDVSSRFGSSTFGCLVELIHASERSTRADIEGAVRRLEAVSDATDSAKWRSARLRYAATALRWVGHIEEAMGRAVRSWELARSAGLLDEASLALELLTFTLLDAERLDEAQHWLELWCASSRVGEYVARHQSLVNASSRMLMQRNRHADALALYKVDMGSIRRDLMSKRRTSDMSTIAYCAAVTGENELTTELSSVISAALAHDQPSPFMDYAAELHVRTLHIIASAPEALAYRDGYISDRRSRCELPIAPFCRELKACAVAS